jgi:hypothetical protein
MESQQGRLGRMDGASPDGSNARHSTGEKPLERVRRKSKKLGQSPGAGGARSKAF